MDRRKSLAKNFAVHGKKDDDKQDSDVFLSELISHRPETKVEDALNSAPAQALNAAQAAVTSAAKDQMQETADKLNQDASAVLK